MTGSFLFRPHVAGADAVVTPDVVIDRVVISTSVVGQRCTIDLPLDRLTTGIEIQVIGENTLPDAALVVIAAGSNPLIGLMADHFDQALSHNSPRLARQVCAKSICRMAWRYKDVVDHIDELNLRCWVGRDGGDGILIQDGAVSELGDVAAIIDEHRDDHELPNGLAILCSGLPLEQTPSNVLDVRLQLSDPILGRALDHAYRVIRLAVKAKRHDII